MIRVGTLKGTISSAIEKLSSEFSSGPIVDPEIIASAKDADEGMEEVYGSSTGEAVDGRFYDSFVEVIKNGKEVTLEWETQSRHRVKLVREEGEVMNVFFGDDVLSSKIFYSTVAKALGIEKQFYSVIFELLKNELENGWGFIVIKCTTKEGSYPSFVLKKKGGKIYLYSPDDKEVFELPDHCQQIAFIEPLQSDVYRRRWRVEISSTDSQQKEKLILFVQEIERSAEISRIFRGFTDSLFGDANKAIDSVVSPPSVEKGENDGESR